MRKQKVRNWQVALGVIGFLLIMGIVGKIDQDSQQSILDEKTSIRDQVRTAIEQDERAAVALFMERSRK